MIITRTPFRISFFGGGTDYPVWYQNHGGVVLSAAINKYCYISCRYLPPFFEYTNRIRYTNREEVKSIDEIKHPSVRECLKFLEFEKGIEMVHTSDIPARSGIGSSSAFTVGFLHALYALKGKMCTKRQLAREAINIEQNIIKENVGSQDQVAASFGGLNKIVFGGKEDFFVNPVPLFKEKFDFFQDHFLLFYTGMPRTASDIAGEQIRNTAQKEQELITMMSLTEDAVSILNQDNFDRIAEFGKLLHESWKIKKSLSKLISNERIDRIYDAGISAGALGGKILGAGSGGCILFFVPPYNQKAVKEALKDLLHIPIKFDTMGSQLILYATQDF
jgi:D-glycero-alpha-D-manno-heptose-7-phosphate kinase